MTMIAGACIGCNRIEQLFRKDAGFCQRCGKALTKVIVYATDNGIVARLDSEEA